MQVNGKPRLRRKNEDIRIPRQEWESLKKNPAFGELIELIEDKYDLEKAKTVKGNDVSLSAYLKKRGLRSNS